MMARWNMVVAAAAGWLTMSPVQAVTVAELQQALSATTRSDEARMTLIDVRINALYQQGHLPNAINIPASLLASKQLPKLGRVVVYGDGIDDALVEQAVLDLNAKPGIEAELLEGGISAWSAEHTVVQRQRGMAMAWTKQLTYTQLQRLAERNRDLLLVDLRTDAEQETLATHFPEVPVHDAFRGEKNQRTKQRANRGVLGGLPKKNRKVLVLIDDGNGFAEQVAAKLHGAGTLRLAILAGGEQALRARGETTQVVTSSGDQ